MKKYHEGLGRFNRFEAGNDSNIRFWHTCGDQALKEAFPDLYSITCVKDASMTDHLELSHGSHKCNAWNVSFIRATHN